MGRYHPSLSNKPHSAQRQNNRHLLICGPNAIKTTGRNMAILQVRAGVVRAWSAIEYLDDDQHDVHNTHFHLLSKGIGDVGWVSGAVALRHS